MEAIIQQKKGNTSKTTNLNGYDQGLEMKIRKAFERLKDSPDREEKISAHWQMAGLMALRNPEYVKELEFQKFGVYL